ncbi:hypothetical protein C8F01DRAFT_1256940 [Mycena amicta]|nr:hypothetical protein C8F01DRAFT_1256940 [Mycena amicta]
MPSGYSPLTPKWHTVCLHPATSCKLCVTYAGTLTITHQLPAASLLRALDTTDPLAVARSITQATSSKKRHKTATEKPKRKRDTWTCWPLLVNNITLPQFGLDDEIAVLARNCLRDTIDPDEMDDDNNLLDPISTSAAAFLSSTLALLAHHTCAHTEHAGLAQPHRLAGRVGYCGCVQGCRCYV